MKPSENMSEPSAEVWLVEDNEPFRRSALRVIEAIGFVRSARGFRSCEEALEVVRAGGRPQIVLLDVALPGMSGLEGIGLFKQAITGAQIVILTVFDDAEKVFRAIRAGADGYLLKGASVDELQFALEEIRRGGAPMNGRIARMVLQAFSRDQGAAAYGLTPREREILEGLVRGLTKKEIAAQIEVSFHTVDFHLRGVYQKLHVNNRSSAVAKALNERLT